MQLSKPKVVLLQLNNPDNKPVIPLAPGYLKAMAYKAGLLKKVDVEILNARLNNSAGDACVISAIVERNPGIVGFSCYVWNIERSLHIINSVKQKLPHVRIVCGGTEASSQYKKIMRNKNIDIMAIGEGELIFVDVLRNFLFKAPPLEKIQGIVFRKKQSLIATPRREQIPDINTVPSPYVLGFIDPQEYGSMILETYRGCIEKCTYCNWRRNSHGIRYFKAERIKAELAVAREKKACVRVIDTIFNLPYNLTRLSGIIKEANYDNSMDLRIEGRAEYVTEGQARLLSQCNIANMVIGLQSLNPVALRNIQRWFDKKLFIRGVRLLKKAKIPLRLDVILGLPGDTLPSIKKALRFAKRHNRDGFNLCDLLQVQPDTPLRRQVKKFRLKYLKHMPYYVLSTKELPRHEIKELSTFSTYNSIAFSRKNHSHSTRGLRVDEFPFLPQQDYAEVLQDGYVSHGRGHAISDFFVEIGKGTPTIKSFRAMAFGLRQHVGLKTRIAFKCKHSLDNYRLIREFLSIVSRANPFSKFRIFIESDEIAESAVLRAVDEAVTHKPSYQDYQLRHFADLLGVKKILKNCEITLIVPFSRRTSSITKGAPDNLRILSKVAVSQDADYRKILRDAFNASPGNLLIDFDSGYRDLFFLAKALRYIYTHKRKNMVVTFYDFILNSFYQEIIISRKPVTWILYEFRSGSSLFESRMASVDSNGNKTFQKYNVSRTVSKFFDLHNAYQKAVH